MTQDQPAPATERIAAPPVEAQLARAVASLADLVRERSEPPTKTGSGRLAAAAKDVVQALLPGLVLLLVGYGLVQSV